MSIITETQLRQLIRESLSRKFNLRAVTNQIYQLIKIHLPKDMLDPRWNYVHFDWSGGNYATLTSSTIDSQKNTTQEILPDILATELNNLKLGSIHIEVNARHGRYAYNQVEGRFNVSQRAISIKSFVHVWTPPTEVDDPDVSLDDPEEVARHLNRIRGDYDEGKHREEVQIQLRKLFETLLHELTHARQAEAGWNAKYVAFDPDNRVPYLTNPAEVEAWVKAAKEHARNTGNDINVVFKQILDNQGVRGAAQEEVLEKWRQQYALQYVR
jgi:hypothetical protein